MDILILFIGAFAGIGAGVYQASEQSNKILEIESRTREKLLQIEFIQENVIQKQTQILEKKVELIRQMIENLNSLISQTDIKEDVSILEDRLESEML